MLRYNMPSVNLRGPKAIFIHSVSKQTKKPIRINRWRLSLRITVFYTFQLLAECGHSLKLDLREASTEDKET